MFCVFSSRLGRLQSPVFEFDKKCTQNANFLKKVDFCIFAPKNREWIENSSKTPLNFSPLQCTHLGRYSFQYHKGLVRKNGIEKWLLRTSVQCIFLSLFVLLECVLMLMTSTTETCSMADAFFFKSLLMFKSKTLE